MHFITKGKPTPLNKVQEEILPRILSYYAKAPPRGCWAAHLRDTGEFVGWFLLRADRLEPAGMELGFRLKRSAWGRGLATEGSIALLAKGFEEWDYSKICARALVGNLASRRLMEKSGLQFEREFVYPLEIIPGWSEEERHGVKYSLKSSG